MAKKHGASFNPDSFEEGGGLLNGVEVAWKDCKFDMNDYQGKADPAPAFCATLVPDEGEEVTQFWSCGSVDDWKPSDDGMEMVAIGTAKGFRKNCNFVKLISSLIAAGFPKDKLTESEGRADLFDGMRTIIVQQPQKDFAGADKTRVGKDGRTYPVTVPIVDKITKLPWEGGKKGASKSTGKTADKGKKSEDADTDLDGTATEAIMAVLGDAPKGMKKMQLIGAVFTYLKKQGTSMPEINAVTRHIKDSEILDNGPWEMDGDVVKMG